MLLGLGNITGIGYICTSLHDNIVTVGRFVGDNVDTLLFLAYSRCIKHALRSMIASKL